MAAQVSKPQPKYVKCLRPSQNGKLTKGKVYEVVRCEYNEYALRDGGRDIGWYYDSYFEVMPPTYDHVEQKLRSILTAPVHACNCSKCGAPKPCAYHG